MLCKSCGQLIQGEYVCALGYAWHKNHFCCEACNRSILNDKFYIHLNKPYHEICYGKFIAQRCEYCKTTIMNQHCEYQGKLYHDSCYENYIVMRCSHCQQIINGQFYKDNGKQYDSKCFSDFIAPRCVYCSKPLTDDHLVDYWGDHFCGKHNAEYLSCIFCSRLVPAHQSGHDNASVCCIKCRASSINSMSQATPHFTLVAKWLKQQGLTFNNLNLCIELCDRKHLLAAKTNSLPANLLGLTLCTTYSDNLRNYTKVDSVALLRGLPSVVFQGVAAHELGHVWMAVHGVKKVQAWAEEGFCEFLAYKFYSHLNTKESKYQLMKIEQSKDPIYGGGFRRIQEIVSAVGFPKFLEKLYLTKQIPLN